MTITRVVQHLTRPALFGALALMPFGATCAWQVHQQPVIRPVSSGATFQQTVQQQHTRDQLQKSQLQQQLRQDVSDNARRPLAKNSRAQQQADQADRAQRDRDRASRQSLIDRDRDAATVQRTRDHAQKHQTQQQLRQEVSDNAKRPLASNSPARQQDQADRDGHDRDRAKLQDLLGQHDAADLPRVVPKALPATTHKDD